METVGRGRKDAARLNPFLPAVEVREEDTKEGWLLYTLTQSGVASHSPFVFMGSYSRGLPLLQFSGRVSLDRQDFQ